MSIKDLKEREKEQRREYIIDEAEKLFFARGYDNVTMDDIAKAVELNKATLYLYFKDKESLYFTIVLKGVCLLHGMVLANVKKGKFGSEKLWEVGHAYFSFAREYPDYNRAYNYFYSGRFDLSGLTEAEEPYVTLSMLDSGPKFWKSVEMAANRASNDVARQIIRLNREIFVLMSSAIQEGIEEGAYRRDLDPAEAAIVFTLLLESMPRMRPDLEDVLDGHGIDRRKFARDVGDFIANMLAARAPGQKRDD